MGARSKSRRCGLSWGALPTRDASGLANDKAQEIRARAKEHERAVQKEASDRAERRVALLKEQIEAGAQATIAQA